MLLVVFSELDFSKILPQKCALPTEFNDVTVKLREIRKTRLSTCLLPLWLCVLHTLPSTVLAAFIAFALLSGSYVIDRIHWGHRSQHDMRYNYNALQ